MKTAKLNIVDRATLETGDVLVLPATVQYYFIENNEQAEEAFNLLLPIVSNPQSTIAYDLETTGLDPYTSDILLLQIGLGDNTQFVYDARKIDKKFISPLLDSPCWKLGQNLKFDAKFTKAHYGVTLTHLFDTLIAEQVIRGGEHGSGWGYSLTDIIKRRLGLELRIEVRNTLTEAQANKLEKAKKYMQESFLNHPKDKPFTEAQLAYAAHDTGADTIFALARWQRAFLKEEKPNILYNEDIQTIDDIGVREEYERVFPPTKSLWDTALLEFKFLEVVISLELAGIKFCKDTHKQVMDYVYEDYDQYRDDFLDLLGKHVPQKTLFGKASINPDSQKQVLGALNYIGVAIEDTSAENLELKLHSLKPGSIQYNAVKALLNYRTAAHTIKSFGDSLSCYLNKKTGRIHPEIKQILDTGRMAMAEPNLQQIPRQLEWRKTGDSSVDAVIGQRKGIRECFMADTGRRLLIFDYSMQELRVAASVTQDRTMLNAFAKGMDLHSYSASLIYNVPYEKIEAEKKTNPEVAEMRNKAKTLNFSCLYGTGPSNLAIKLNISFDEAKHLLEQFWYAYPQLAQAMRRYGELGYQYGYSNTVEGRRRYFDDVLERIKWISAEKNPKVIEKKLTDMKMFWVLEKSGPLTDRNIWDGKNAIIKKYKGEIARRAGNMIIQGTSASMTKLAAVKIHTGILNRKLDAMIVGLVHDELIVDCSLECLEECKDLIKHSMHSALNTLCPNVPALTTGEISVHWKK